MRRAATSRNAGFDVEESLLIQEGEDSTTESGGGEHVRFDRVRKATYFALLIFVVLAIARFDGSFPHPCGGVVVRQVGSHVVGFNTVAAKEGDVGVDTGVPRSSAEDWTKAGFRPDCGGARLPALPYIVSWKPVFRVEWAWVCAPDEFMPSKQELAKSPELLKQRRRFWTTALLLLTGVMALVAQTAAVVIFMVRKKLLGLQGPTSDTWVLSADAAVWMQVAYVVIAVAVVVFTYAVGALSANTGLAWEAWALVILLNGGDMLVQSALRAATMPLTGSPPFIMSDAIMTNFPMLSPKMDLVKDLIFIALCAEGACSGIYVTLLLLSQNVFLLTLLRTWTTTERREEVRLEHCKVLRPTTSASSPGLAEALKSRDKMNRLAVDAMLSSSSPGKQDNAIMEDLPQACLQASLGALAGFSPFLLVSVIIAAVKCVLVVAMAFALRGQGNIVLLQISLRGAFFSKVRAAAALALGQRLAASTPTNGDDVAAMENGKQVEPAEVQPLQGNAANDDQIGAVERSEVLLSLAAVVTADQKARVRKAAMEALASLGPSIGEEVAKVFVSGLKDKAAANVIVAIDALRSVGPLIHAEASGALAEMAKGNIGQVRASCLGALCQIAESDTVVEDAFARLRYEWKDDPVLLNELFASAIKNADYRVRKFVFESYVGGFEHDVYRKVSQGAVQGLVRALDSDTEIEVRHNAVVALRKVGGPQALAALVRALELNEDGTLRAAAAIALGDIGGQEAVHALVKALRSDGAEEARAAAATGLGAIGGPEAVAELVRALGADEYFPVRAAAVTALGNIGTPEVRPVIIKALHDDNRDDVRAAAATALGVVGGPEAIEALALNLANTDPYVRRFSQEALLGILADPEAAGKLRAFKVIRPDGLRFLKSRDVDDELQLIGPENSIVRGVLEENGEWVRFASNLFLPTRLEDVPVLQPQAEDHASLTGAGSNGNPSATASVPTAMPNDPLAKSPDADAVGPTSQRSEAVWFAYCGVCDASAATDGKV